MPDSFYKSKKSIVKNIKAFTDFWKLSIIWLLIFLIFFTFISLLSLNVDTLYITKKTFIFDIFILIIMLYFLPKLSKHKVIAIIILTIF